MRPKVLQFSQNNISQLRDNFEQYSNGVLCFCWMPDYTSYMMDINQRCSFLDSRGPCLHFRTKVQGVCLNEEEQAQVQLGTGIGPGPNPGPTPSYFTANSANWGVQQRQDFYGFNVLPRVNGLSADVASALGVVGENPQANLGICNQYGLKVTETSLGGMRRAEIILPAFAPARGDDADMGELAVPTLAPIGGVAGGNNDHTPDGDIVLPGSLTVYPEPITEITAMSEHHTVGKWLYLFALDLIEDASLFTSIAKMQTALGQD